MRQAKAIKQAYRYIPHSISQLLGDAFVKNGIEVHYSIEDNDDTLAYYAYTDGAIIMSEDSDMWRYRPQPKVVYSDFKICRKNGVEFI